jgi:Phosphotransferase system IIC components, glucose/maltose/N-acetylglucosamine-specific
MCSASSIELGPKEGIFKTALNKIIEFLSAAFGPFLMVVAAAGLLKGIIMVLAALGMMTEGSGTFNLLGSISDACFHFLPVFLAINISRYYGTSEFINALVALSLVFPGMVAHINSEIPAEFMGFGVMAVSYGANLFPVLLASIASCYLEKALNKILPPLLQGFMTPLICLAVIIPLTLVVIGPFGALLSSSLSAGFTYLFELNPIICSAVISPAYLLLCIVGLHWALVPIMLNNIALTGRDPVMAACSVCAGVCFGISLALAIKSKTVDSRSRAIGAACPAIFGIMEPTLFGALIPLKMPLILATVIHIVAGGFIGAFGSSAVAFAPPGPTSLLLALGPGFWPLVIVCLLAAVAAFAGMMCMKYDTFPDPAVTAKETEQCEMPAEPEAGIA